MTKIKNHKAFSLVEISMVILVIGILIAGVSQGIDLYDDYRLASARNLTKNSLVNRIPDLEMWFEATSENSLATGTTTFTDKANPVDQDSIGRWNNINPNILPSARNNATQNNPTALVDNQPKYIRKGMNGLPALLFDGNDFLSYNGNFLVGSDYTIFVVEARNSYIEYDNFFLIGTAGDCGQNLRLGYKLDTTIMNDHFCQNMSKTIPAYSSTITRIHSFTFGSALGKSIYTNGAGLVMVSNQANKNPLSGYPSSRIGGVVYKGYIAEIIFYTRALTDKERQGVETYLSKKWSIKLG